MSGILGTNYGDFAKQIPNKREYDQNTMQAFADAGKAYVDAITGFATPHSRKDPLNPMAYVKDVNEWLEPAAQMASDELSGEAEYPAWAYGIASLPVVGKLGKSVAKAAKGAKGAKGAAQPLMDAIDRLGNGKNKPLTNADGSAMPQAEMFEGASKASVNARLAENEMLQKNYAAIIEQLNTTNPIVEPEKYGKLKEYARQYEKKMTDNGVDFSRGYVTPYEAWEKASAKPTGVFVDADKKLVDELNAAQKAWDENPTLVNQARLERAHEAVRNSDGTVGTREGSFVPWSKSEQHERASGLLADTPAGPYNVEFVPGEGSIMEGAKPKKYVMHYPDGGELEFESMEKLKEYADLLRKNVGVGGGFKIIER